MPFDSPHKQVSVELPDWHGGHVSVDEALVPILSRIWSTGFRTYYSCQGGYWVDPDISQQMPAYILGDLKGETLMRQAIEHFGHRIERIEFDEGLVCVRFELNSLQAAC